MSTTVHEASSSGGSSRFTLRDAMLVMLLCIVTAIVLGKDITVGGFRYGDSAVHAMDGVLIHDWVAQGPQAWSHPMAFALEQYAYYPALGIGRHYPPGFAVVEAFFFSIFGISPFTARLCVVFFGFVAVAGAYLFMRPLTNRLTALLTGLILLTMHATTLWGRQTMLELPTLAVLIWAAVAFSWYLRRPGWRRLITFLALSLLAVLFKQPGIFMVAALTVTLGVCAIRGLVPARHFLCAVALAGAAGFVTVTSLGTVGAQMVHTVSRNTDSWSWDALTFYLRGFPQMVGVIVLVGAVGGVVLSRRKLGAHWTLLVSWVVVCTLMATAVDWKNQRFIYVGLFPFAAFAAIAGAQLLNRIRIAGVRTALASVVVIGLGAAGMAAPVPHRPDYGVVVAANADKIHHKVVLFSGLRDGDFVFAVRQHLPWRQAVVIRGSKLLYTCNALVSLDFVSKVSSLDDVDRLMQKYAFDYVFVERENKLDLAEDALLREYLARGPAYRYLRTYPFQVATSPNYRNVQMDVYEGVRVGPRKIAYLDIPMPRINRTIRVALDQNWK